MAIPALFCVLSHLPSLLALISYYFTSGPWKTLWVKLGYDPRSTPASKVYQCLDFRVPKDLIWMMESKKERYKPRAGVDLVGGGMWGVLMAV